MRALIQRVSMSRVRVDDITVGEIKQGLLVLLGVAPDDTIADRNWLLRKILNLRIFADEEGRFVGDLTVHPLCRCKRGKSSFVYALGST